MEKKKLDLHKLKVKSFITELEDKRLNQLKAGFATAAIECNASPAEQGACRPTPDQPDPAPKEKEFGWLTAKLADRTLFVCDD